MLHKTIERELQIPSGEWVVEFYKPIDGEFYVAKKVPLEGIDIKRERSLFEAEAQEARNER